MIKIVCLLLVGLTFSTVLGFAYADSYCSFDSNNCTKAITSDGHAYCNCLPGAEVPISCKVYQDATFTLADAFCGSSQVDYNCHSHGRWSPSAKVLPYGGVMVNKCI